MVARVLLGNLSSGYGLKVSKPGYDVTTTGAENLLFDSTGNLYRIRASYTLTLVGSSSARSTNVITHGLGTVPLVVYSISGGGNVTNMSAINIYTNSTQLGCGSIFSLGAGNNINVICHLITEFV